MSLRMSLIVRNTIAAGFLAAAFLGTASIAAPQYRQITILHTNDTHGHLIPFSYPDPPSSDWLGTKWPSTIRNIGGIARRATITHQIENEMKRNVLLVDAGDELDGTPFSVEYMGEADFAAMNAAGYDLKTFGNHEFSASLAEFKHNLKTAAFPTLCANLIDQSTGKPIALPYKIIDFDGAKVAFFGLVTPAPTYKAAKEGLEFTQPIATASALVPELKKQADIVIAITHIGEEMDVQLAREVPGIDGIIGGHSHTRLAEPVFIRNTQEPSAFRVGGTVITQAGQWGQELGRLDLRLRSDGVGPYTLMSYKGSLLPITSDIPEDPATTKVLDRYLKPIWKNYGEIIGEAEGSFYDDREKESTMMHLVCDAMRETFGADVTLFNTGGIRDNLASGSVSMWDIATVLPFRNNAMTMQIDGKRLKRALLEMKPGVSGVRYKVDGEQLTEATIDGKPIDDAKVYKVVTNDWFVSFAFKDVTNAVDTKITCRDAVKQYIKSKRLISPASDGRRVNNGSAPPA